MWMNISIIQLFILLRITLYVYRGICLFFHFDGRLGFPVHSCYDYSCGSLCIAIEVQEKNGFVYMILLYLTFKVQSSILFYISKVMHEVSVPSVSLPTLDTTIRFPSAIYNMI